MEPCQAFPCADPSDPPLPRDYTPIRQGWQKANPDLTNNGMRYNLNRPDARYKPYVYFRALGLF